MTSKRHIFVSYSHSQSDVLNEVVGQLKPMLRQLGDFELWYDHALESGADWNTEILGKLETAVAALVLVSPEALSSSYMREKELPRLLQRWSRKQMLLSWLSVLAAPFEDVAYDVDDGTTRRRIGLSDVQALGDVHAGLPDDAQERSQVLKAAMREFAKSLEVRFGKAVARGRAGRQILVVRLEWRGSTLHREYLDDDGQRPVAPRSSEFDSARLSEPAGMLEALFPGGDSSEALRQISSHFSTVAHGGDPTPRACSLHVRVESPHREFARPIWNRIEFEGHQLAPLWLFEWVENDTMTLTFAPERGLALLAPPIGGTPGGRAILAGTDALFEGIPVLNSHGRRDLHFDGLGAAQSHAVFLAVGSCRASDRGPELICDDGEILLDDLARHTAPVIVLQLFGGEEIHDWSPAEPIPPGRLLIVHHAGIAHPDAVTSSRARELSVRWLRMLARVEPGEVDLTGRLLSESGGENVRAFSSTRRVKVSSGIPRAGQDVLARVKLDRVTQRAQAGVASRSLQSDPELRCVLLVGHGEPGNHLELLGRHAEEALLEGDVSVLRIQMHPATLRGNDCGEEVWMNAIDPSGRAQTLKESLRLAAPRPLNGRRVVLLLDWSHCRPVVEPHLGPLNLAKALLEGIEPLIEFLRDRLAPQCPSNVRVLGVVGLESEDDCAFELASVYGERVLDWRALNLKVELLPGLEDVTALHILDCILDLGCPEEMARDFARELHREYDGQYEETVIVIERAQRGHQWQAVFDEIRGDTARI